jgi:hypothetical protein
VHDRQWANVTHENFKTIPAKELDLTDLSTDELAAYELLADQGHKSRREEIMNSGSDREISRMNKGRKLLGFTTDGYPKPTDNPYWMTEEEFHRLEQKHCSNGIWSRQAVKDELALPCRNRADALSETTLIQDAEVLAAKINPATETTFYTDSAGHVTQMFSQMPGGGTQKLLVPASKKTTRTPWNA